MLPALGHIALNAEEVKLALCSGMDTYLLRAWVAENASDDTLPLWFSADTNVVRVKRGRLTAAGEGETLVAVIIGDCEPVLVRVAVTAAPVALTLPTSLSVIGEEAFMNSSAMYVIVPDGTESIGSRAFKDCHALQAIVIPASVT